MSTVFSLVTGAPPFSVPPSLFEKITKKRTSKRSSEQSSGILKKKVTFHSKDGKTPAHWTQYFNKNPGPPDLLFEEFKARVFEHEAKVAKVLKQVNLNEAFRKLMELTRIMATPAQIEAFNSEISRWMAQNPTKIAASGFSYSSNTPLLKMYDFMTIVGTWYLVNRPNFARVLPSPNLCTETYLLLIITIIKDYIALKTFTEAIQERTSWIDKKLKEQSVTVEKVLQGISGHTALEDLGFSEKTMEREIRKVMRDVTSIGGKTRDNPTASHFAMEALGFYQEQARAITGKDIRRDGFQDERPQRKPKKLPVRRSKLRGNSLRESVDRSYKEPKRTGSIDAGAPTTTNSTPGGQIQDNLVDSLKEVQQALENARPETIAQKLPFIREYRKFLIRIWQMECTHCPESLAKLDFSLQRELDSVDLQAELRLLATLRSAQGSEEAVKCQGQLAELWFTPRRPQVEVTATVTSVNFAKTSFLKKEAMNLEVVYGEGVFVLPEVEEPLGNESCPRPNEAQDNSLTESQQKAANVSAAILKVPLSDSSLSLKSLSARRPNHRITLKHPPPSTEPQPVIKQYSLRETQGTSQLLAELAAKPPSHAKSTPPQVAPLHRHPPVSRIQQNQPSTRIFDNAPQVRDFNFRYFDNKQDLISPISSREFTRELPLTLPSAKPLARSYTTVDPQSTGILSIVKQIRQQQVDHGENTARADQLIQFYYASAEQQLSPEAVQNVLGNTYQLLRESSGLTGHHIDSLLRTLHSTLARPPASPLFHEAFKNYSAAGYMDVSLFLSFCLNSKLAAEKFPVTYKALTVNAAVALFNHHTNFTEKMGFLAFESALRDLAERYFDADYDRVNLTEYSLLTVQGKVELLAQYLAGRGKGPERTHYDRAPLLASDSRKRDFAFSTVARNIVSPTGKLRYE